MVAGGEHVRAQVKELVGNLRRHAKSAGSIFHVDHQQVDVVCRTDVADVLTHNPASRATENVTNKKNVQKQLLATSSKLETGFSGLTFRFRIRGF